MSDNQLIIRDWQDHATSDSAPQGAPRSSSIMSQGESLWWGGGGITGVGQQHAQHWHTVQRIDSDDERDCIRLQSRAG